MSEPVMQQDAVEQWPRLGALVTVPGRDGIWSVWSRGTTPVDAQEQRWWNRTEPRKWWLIPVDATERDRADLAVLLRDTEFTPYAPAETGSLL